VASLNTQLEEIHALVIRLHDTTDIVPEQQLNSVVLGAKK
jgi:hypothetical protein